MEVNKINEKMGKQIFRKKYDGANSFYGIWRLRSINCTKNKS